MKKILASIFILVCFILPLVGAEEIPNLVGNWTGLGSALVFDARGILPWDPENLTRLEGSNFTIAITEQNGRTFVGKKFPSMYLEESETILGVVFPDNETLYLVDENAQLDGRLISATEMELVYREVGPNGMVIAINKFTRA